jgi:RHS repeat-associated protein
VRKGGTAERWHYVSVGDRLVARVTYPDTVRSRGTVAGFVDRSWRRIEAGAPRAFAVGLVGGALALLAWISVRRPRRAARAGLAVLTSLALVFATSGCGSTGGQQRGLELADRRLYFHQGIAAGPSAITGAAGTIIEERRFEPFGHPIEADLAREPWNGLNKETNPETGWSYHGARWMAPQTARWLTPDPMVKGPEAGLVAAPWTLNPYAYGLQSPTLFWDPDGAWPKLVDDVREGFGTAALVAGGAREPLTPNQLVDRGYWFTLGYLQYGAWTDRLASGKGPSVAALVPPRLQLPGMPVRKALPPMAPKGDVPVAGAGAGDARTSSNVAGNTTRRVYALAEGSAPALSRLPGSDGVQVAGRLSPQQMEALTKAHGGIEFALVYRTGPGPHGAGGTYWLYSGVRNAVEVPVAADVRLIYHTHPAGTPFASQGDRALMKLLEAAGSPQRSSQIVPVGGGNVTRFSRDGSF